MTVPDHESPGPTGAPTSLEAALHRIDADLTHAHVSYALIGIETEVVTDAEVLNLLPRLSMRVATTAHLIALKVLSRDDMTRPQDLVDLRALLRIASEAELARARDALTLIAVRGYHRGRDLIADLDSLLNT